MPASTGSALAQQGCVSQSVGGTETFTCTTPQNDRVTISPTADSDVSAAFSTVGDGSWNGGISVQNQNPDRSASVNVYGGGSSFPLAPNETLGTITISDGGTEEDYNVIEIGTNGGDASFVTDGLVFVQGSEFAEGLVIDTNGGNAFVDTAANFKVGMDAMDIHTSGGDAEIITRGTLDAASDGVYVSSEKGRIDLLAAGNIYAGTDGLDAQSTSGDIAIDLALDAYISAQDNGIDISTTLGNVDLVVRGDIEASSDGVIIETRRGNVKAAVTVNGEIDASGDGIYAQTTQGNVDLRVAGHVHAGDDALDANTNIGDINITLTSDGHLTGDDNGIEIETLSGNVDLQLAGDIEASEDGVNVDTTSGSVGINVTRLSEIDSDSDGLYASTVTGAVNFTVAGDIHVGSDALDANTQAGDITVDLKRDGHLSADDNGIEIETTSGTVDLQIAGEIDADGNGIDVQNTRGKTGAYLARTAEIDASGNGVDISSERGDVSLVVSGDINAGQSAVDIRSRGTIGLGVDTTGLLVGQGSADSAVVEMESSTSIILYNFGRIRSGAETRADRANDFAINLDGGADSLVLNAGNLTGRFNGSAGDDTFANTGTWTFTGNSNFGGGENEFANAGGLIVNAVRRYQGETTQYLSLDGFFNEGIISLQDQESGDSFRRDRVLVDGDYAGDGGVIALDVSLGQNNVDMINRAPEFIGRDSDRFIVNGDVSGTTLVALNNIWNGPVEFDANDIPVIQVSGMVQEGTSFKLQNGPLDFGLFSYDLYQTDDMEGYLQEGDGSGANSLATGGLAGAPLIDSMWVLSAKLDEEAYQTPVLAYAAGNIWQATAGVWGDRTSDLRTGFGGTGFGGGGADVALDPAAPVQANAGPGFWGRAFGGTLKRDFDNTVTVGGVGETYEDSFRQNYYGVVGGLDFAQQNVGQDSAWLFGILGGFTGSDVEFDLSAGDVKYQQISLGAYATYLNGGFFADAMFKADFGNMDFSSGGLADTLDASYTTVGVVADVGYRFGFAAGWFVEPKATIAYVNTDFDSAEVLGTGVEFDNGQSLRGRVGARVGATLDRGGNLLTPYVEASVWNEFDGDYSAAFTGIGATQTVSYDVGGTYGEIAAGADFMNVGSGWSAYAKGSVQIGEDDMLGFGGNLGFRKSW